MKQRPPNLDLPIPRRRALTAQEAQLWQSVTADDAPPKQARKETQPVKATKAQKTEKSEKLEKTKKPVVKKSAPPQAMDASARAYIHSGRSQIQATLDLHGHTVETAYRMLMNFLEQKYASKIKLVLVITGKGRTPQSGILRMQLPRWLELPPFCDYISGYGPAGKTHGGEGAWYIRLKKGST